MLRSALGLSALLALTLHLPASAQRIPCVDGFAGGYACSNVDLLARVPLSTMDDTDSNDIWGWTDSQTGKEYALVGLTNGTAFVDVSDPENPAYLGKLPTYTQASPWRDIKVHAGHAFIVSEASGHGMQVFDLTKLRDVTTPQTFEADAHYDRVGDVHNVAVNEETGYAYLVGNRSTNGCAGGLHMVDVSDPLNPAFAGCFADDGYTHDVQCVVYDGPDAEHAGKEVCLASNEDTVTIVDVTDKAAPVMLSQAIYPNPAYTHQGWLTDDHRFFIAGDELDEQRFGNSTRTLVFDVADLDAPAFRGAFLHDTPTIDHNLYVKDRFVYQSNYTSGLRILDANGLLTGTAPGAGLETVAFFDTYPANDGVDFNGTWSNYPYFESGIVIVNDGSGGLFILEPQLDQAVAEEPAALPGSFALTAAYPNPFSVRTELRLRVAEVQTVQVAAYDVLGRRVADLFHGPVAAGAEQIIMFDGTGLPVGTYLVRVTGERFAETHRVTLTR